MKSIARGILVSLLLVSVAAGAAFGGGAAEAEETKGDVTLLYVEWAGEIAATYVAQVVLEEMGYSVTATPVSAAAMWQGMASGDGDGMLSAWLPATHGDYLSQTEDRIDLLSPILEGARIGLLVPTYVEIDTVAQLNDYADRFGGQIIGIDPGAGLMAATENALDVYGLDNMTLVEGSDAAMTAALGSAVDNDEWIVVTGWTPHWKEAAWDLKYLEDPEVVFGEEEYVAAVARDGLADDMPEVHEFLDNFFWTPEQLGEVLMWNEEAGADPYETAQRWVAENRSIVETWIP
ncbi:MAG: glycine betaine ABC transporter substrate-binding protein [Spirochaetaceae bacterium]|nr:MAG: glycine betaine ABC transporter substrate-binding protein [Spirochaetaceae bacterium]